MKRRIAMFLALLMLVAATVPASFAASSEGYRITKPHEYAIKPGTSEWRSMDNVLDRRAACHVPEDELKMMTTEALVKTVLEYPLLVDMCAYNSIDEGIEAVSEYFGGIKELAERKDALKYLEEYIVQQADQTDGANLLCFFADTLIRYITKEYAQHERASFPPIYTPKKTPVPNSIIHYNLTWASFGTNALIEQDIANLMLQIYTSASIVAQPSPKYNCHSYAWHSQSTATNKYWIDYPDVYLNDGSYSMVTVPTFGTRVTYFTNTYGYYTHSGIIWTPVVVINKKVTSKWGKSALFTHNVDDCPYYTNGSNTSVKYWDRNP
ncbi:MAG: hypothetical protein II871_07545 [Clostridia bacterium]|nr:hypothetical protein [Clostridia bacterium]